MFSVDEEEETRARVLASASSRQEWETLSRRLHPEQQTQLLLQLEVDRRVTPGLEIPRRRRRSSNTLLPTSPTLGKGKGVLVLFLATLKSVGGYKGETWMEGCELERAKRGGRAAVGTGIGAEESDGVEEEDGGVRGIQTSSSVLLVPSNNNPMSKSRLDEPTTLPPAPAPAPAPAPRDGDTVESRHRRLVYYREQDDPKKPLRVHSSSKRILMLQGRQEIRLGSRM
ncbi:hypothetical protein CPC08DRAFT_769990 [Agrocybe pediades]|nr:hypothetical protein CPC08DRAFT_769990 [Agrocybe pediades]